MGKMLDGLKRLKIKQQILWSMLVLSICSTLFIGVTVAFLSGRIIERNYRQAYTRNLNVTSNVLDIQLNNIIELIRGILLEEDIILVLKQAGADPASDQFTAAQSLRMMKRLGEIAGQDDKIEGITLFSLDGKPVLYYKSLKSGIFSRYYDKPAVLEEEWTLRAARASGRELFYGYDVLAPQVDGYFSLVKYVLEPFTNEPVGYMTVSIRNRLFEKAFGENVKDPYDTAASMVLGGDPDRPLVYYSGEEQDGEEISARFTANADEDAIYLFSSVTDAKTGWKLINVIEKADLKQDSRYIFGIDLLVMLFLALICVLLANRISKWINRPLGKLETVIGRVGEGDRHIEETFDDSEIGRIGGKFKIMVNHNLELRERLLQSRLKEREAELLLVQAQINPHFLYNSLDSLYCMAIIDGNDRIAEMVEALSDIFKISLSRGSKLIRVQEELTYIRKYMLIQNIRFNNRFHLEMDVDPRLEQFYMLKLLLQPFVENAVIHGLEPKLGKGTIRLRGVIEEGDIVFTVQDDGVGIGDLSAVEAGYGVRNVRERIALFYGSGYGIEFESGEGQGTKVTVRIPILTDNCESYELRNYSRQSDH